MIKDAEHLCIITETIKIGAHEEDVPVYIDDEDSDCVHRICYYKKWTFDQFVTRALVLKKRDIQFQEAKKLIKKGFDFHPAIKVFGYEVFRERRRDYGWARWHFINARLFVEHFGDALNAFREEMRLRKGYTWTYYSGWDERSNLEILRGRFAGNQCYDSYWQIIKYRLFGPTTYRDDGVED